MSEMSSESDYDSSDGYSSEDDDQKMDKVLDELNVQEEEVKEDLSKRRRTLIDGPILAEGDNAFGDIFSEGNVKGDQIKKKMELLEKNNKTLQTELSKPESERIQRKILVKKVNKEAGKWDDVAQQYQRQDHQMFPRPQQPITSNYKGKMPTGKSRMATCSLEAELMAALGPKEKEIEHGRWRGFREKDKEALEKMSEQEARERLRELQKARIYVGKMQQVFKRNKKIKSKNFRRVQRKKKEKEQQKAMELAGSDHESVDEEEERLRARAKERATLAHRGQGKWHKNKQKIARYNEDVRDKMNAEMDKHKELMKKKIVVNDSESDESDCSEEEGEKPSQVLKVQPLKSNNLWLAAEEDEEEEELEDAKDEQAARNEQKFTNALASLKAEHAANELEKAEREEQESKEREANTVMVEVETEEAGLDGTGATEMVAVVKKPEEILLPVKVTEGDEEMIVVGGGKQKKAESADDDLLNDFVPDENAMMMAEAFAEDDVFAEYEAQENEKIKVDVADSEMPGFGTGWAGEGIKPKKKRAKKRKMKEEQAAKEKNNYPWIPSKHRDIGITKLQVKQIPWQYHGNVQAFERSLHYPVGREHNTELCRKKFDKPEIETVAGKFISPMHPDAVKAMDGKRMQKKGKPGIFGKSKKEKHYERVGNLGK